MLKTFFTVCIFCVFMATTVFAFSAEEFYVKDISARNRSARDFLARDFMVEDPSTSPVGRFSARDFMVEDFSTEDSSAERFSTEDFFGLEEVHEIELFKITNGLLSGVHSTFNDILAISGQAPRDTVITISVYTPHEYDPELLVSEDFFEFLVGSSGIFSHIINLSIGENYIVIYAYNDGNITLIKTIVNRKDDEIKQELSRGLAFPGRSTLNRRIIDLS